MTVLRQKINDIRFVDIENIKVGDMLYYVYTDNLSKTYLINAIYHILRDTFFVGNVFDVSGVPNKIFLFSHSYSDRLDLLRSFNKVYDTCTDSIRMIGRKTRKIHISYIRYLKYIFIWSKQLKKAVPQIANRLYYLEKLYEAYIDYKEYEKFAFSQGFDVKKIITWCDVHAIDYFFTRRFQENGHSTMTLQHGVYSAQSNSWAFLNSKSDYFLAHGQFTLDEAMRAGYDIKKMIPVGLPSSINQKFIQRSEENKTDILGVIPEGESCRNDNVEMILFIQEYCKKYKKRMILKLHPTSNVEDYIDILDSSVCEKVYGREISIVEFGEKIDIAVVRNSTGLLEMVEQLIPTFVFYSEKQELDVYKQVDSIRFCSFEVLQALIEQLNDKDKKDILKQRKAYFCAEGNIAMNYQNAIEHGTIDGD